MTCIGISSMSTPGATFTVLLLLYVQRSRTSIAEPFPDACLSDCEHRRGAIIGSIGSTSGPLTPVQAIVSADRYVEAPLPSYGADAADGVQTAAASDSISGTTASRRSSTRAIVSNVSKLVRV